jgi:hypothetical protein
MVDGESVVQFLFWWARLRCMLIVVCYGYTMKRYLKIKPQAGQ